ncbi:MAG: hypothetical protein R6U51_09200 [Anaerolineales bacterium]
MNKEKRTNIAGGIILVLVGAALLAVQILPGVFIQFSWPWIVIIVGLFLFGLGAAIGEPGMVVPACIVGGIGGILYYQNLTGNWESWSFVWSLILGFVGVGIILMNLLSGEGGNAFREGGFLVLISLTLFAVFGSFFGALGLVGDYWPVLLILLGVLVLLRPLLIPKK